MNCDIWVENKGYVPLSSFAPCFETQGIKIVGRSDSNSGEHLSAYFIGSFDNKKVGVIFGRPSHDYKNASDVLPQLNHEGIPKLHGVGNIQFGDISMGYLIVQHFEGKSLRNITDLKTKQGQQQTASRLLNLLDIVDYLHSQNFVHNDITPDHIIVNGDAVGLIDYHLCDKNYFPIADFCGTIGYPEIINSYYTSLPTIRSMDFVPKWEPRSIGRVLVEISGSYDNPFAKELTLTGIKLQNKTHRFKFHDKARDYTSRKLRMQLERMVVQ